jgi:hypothetical protein
MLLEKSPATLKCYQHWQSHFKEKIIELKKGHWIKFLASCNNVNLFKAYKHTKHPNNNNIAPLLNEENQLTSNKEEQARLLFKGTSDVPVDMNSDDIPPFSLNSPFFPPITHTKLCLAIKELPNKKAKGHNDVPNETIKWGQQVLAKVLLRIFNACLNLGYFPTFWKHAITAIIRKANKDTYSSPNSYRPIALISCLGKVFEGIIPKRIPFYAENNQIIAEGHFGGQAGRSTDDANLFLTLWIRKKWRERKIVLALFLDVKSALLSVVKERLLDTMIKRNFPPYLLAIILNILSNRTTSLKMEDYLSPFFNTRISTLPNLINHIQLITSPPSPS